MSRMFDLMVGSTIRVRWSNGHGYSVYRVEDNPGSGPHVLTLVEEQNVTEAAPDACPTCGALRAGWTRNGRCLSCGRLA